MFRHWHFLLSPLLTVFLFSCSRQEKASEVLERPGNHWTGNHFLINDLGDTIPTGVPVPATGKRIDPDSTAELSTFSYPVRSESRSVRSNVWRVDPPRVVAAPEELPAIIPGQDGVPPPKRIPLRLEVVPAKQPAPMPLSPPGMKETARVGIQNLGLAQGFVPGNVYTIFEDSRGNLWFGAGSSRIIRYDGLNLTEYTQKEGYNATDTRVIMEDSQGNLWFGTTNNLIRFDGVNFFYLNIKGDFGKIRSMVEDKKGTLWIGTEKNGLYRYDYATDRGVILNYTMTGGLEGKSVFSMLEDSAGDLWFGTEKGIIRYDGTGFIHYTIADGVPMHYVYAMLEDSQGYLWFATANGLNRFDGISLLQYTPGQGFFTGSIVCMLEDRRGDLWLGSNRGVFCFNGHQIIHYGAEEGLSIPRVWGMLEDSHGILWFGIVPGGVDRFSSVGFQFFNEEDGMPLNQVRSLMADHEGNVWFSRLGGGLWRYEHKDGSGESGYLDSLTSYYLAQDIRSILKDSRGNLWVGGLNGVRRLNFEHIDGQLAVRSMSLTTKKGLSSNEVVHILEDKQGNIWFGTRDKGASRYRPDSLDGGSFTHFTMAEGLPDNSITFLMEDKRGNIWLGTQNGVSCYDGARFLHYSVQEGLSSNFITYIMEDSRGNLWLGTASSGISVCDPERKRFTHYRMEEGLNDNEIKTIIEDGQGNIWVSTRSSISLFTPPVEENTSARTAGYQIFTFNHLNGLKRQRFIKAVCRDEFNRIWWGSNEGLTMLDMNQFQLERRIPKVSLTHLEIDQHYVDFRQLPDTTYRHSLPIGRDLIGTFDSVAAFRNYPLRLILPYDLNHLTFHFTAPYWSAPGAVRFSYQVEGVDARWSPPTSENKADYRNLPPGKYTFKVKAIGAASLLGEWSDVFEYPFTIRPPWWRTWWAYLGYLGLILLALYGLRRYELRRYLAISEAKRLQELDTFKTRLYTNITHEFRTPLTIILGMVRQIREDPKKWYGEGLEMIHRNGRQLLQLVNQLLDLGRLDRGKLQLTMQQSEIVSFLHYLVQSFESYAATRDIQLHFLKEVDRLEMDYDPDQLTKIVSNLLANAVKYTPAGGQVYMIVESRSTLQGASSGAYLRIRVKDSGPGIPPEELPRIFDRFYQVDASSTRKGEGSGIGLALARELVQLMGGEIRVQSRLGEGTDFIVLLPVSRSAPSSPLSIEKNGWDAGDWLAGSMEKDVIEEPGGADLPVVLLIEDNRDVLTYLASCLESSYQLEFAVNGREGIEQALELVPDLIISDVMMPDKDGYEVCATLKEDIRTSHIPIILLTAKADRDARLEGLKAGADTYLAKPFDREELEVLMEKMLALRRQLQQRYGQVQSAPESTERPATKEALFLADLRKTIEGKLSDESFGIAQLCRAMGMSRSQLHNKIKALTGLSTSHYIRAIRLERAKELLLRTDLNISEIAYEVGFRTPLYFTQSFTEVVGVAPSAFRNEKTRN